VAAWTWRLEMLRGSGPAEDRQRSINP
jgi:hypothetical protein